MTVYEKILAMPKPAYFVLIDPDKTEIKDSIKLAVTAEETGVDAILIGSSILLNKGLEEFIEELKKNVTIPIIVFPGLLNSIPLNADSILFLSMISSRNPQLLIGEQVRAAPLIKRFSLDTISTAYILISSGSITSVQYISNSLPIPADKPDIVVAHCLAAEYLGMKMIYLETGSGASDSVPDAIIKSAKKNCQLPIIVGGGITSPEIAYQKAKAGADIIVTGTILEQNNNTKMLRSITESVHSFRNEF